MNSPKRILLAVALAYAASLPAHADCVLPPAQSTSPAAARTHLERIRRSRSRPAFFRRAIASDDPKIPTDQLFSHGVVEVGGTVAAKGGILFHYNRPYGDIYMEVAEPFRRRGVGSYLVQELKRVCYEQGNIPSARCNPKNIASRKTLQKAGFIPCGHILTGSISG